MTDFELDRLAKQYHSLKKHKLSADLALQTGKFHWLDEKLPQMKEKVRFWNFLEC